MNKELGRDIFFSVYVLAVLALAVIYFTVPEREIFLENQIEWWNEMLGVLIDSINSK